MSDEQNACKSTNFNQIFTILTADKKGELGNLISICQYLQSLNKTAITMAVSQGAWQALTLCKFSFH